MGEANKKSRGKKAILAGEPRCIYCSESGSSENPLTLEHMPPIGMFRNRSRASGLEFACCQNCNLGTKGADIAAGCMSLISPQNDPADWKLSALDRLLPALDQFAPGLRGELVGSKQHTRWMFTSRGLVEPHVQLQANGPILAAYLTVFAAKLAMALYREHVGVALPLNGAVFTTHFLNAGLAKKQADAIVSIMPIFDHLKQGAATSIGQFEYRYNCDEKSIIAALVSLHHNLHVMLFATADPITYGKVAEMPNMRTTRPGELLSRLEGVQLR